MLDFQVGFLASKNGPGHALVPAGFCDFEQLQEKSDLGAMMTAAMAEVTPCARPFPYSLS